MNKNKIVIIVVMISFALAMSGCTEKEPNSTINIREKQHVLKELSFDDKNILKTVVIERWSVFILAGGEKSIAYVDKENVVNFVYGNLEYNNETVYRPMTVSRDKVEIVTIPNNMQPYVRFIDAECHSTYCTSVTPYCVITTGNEYNWRWEINHVRFYLPEGWVILKNDN